MTRRGEERGSPLVVAALAVVLSACVQAPAAVSDDPAYGALAPPAKTLARNTVQEALETLRSKDSLSWSYVEDGSKGKITPLRTYRTSAGFYCREYVEIVETLGDGRSARQRTACRDGDGLWKQVRS